MTTARASRWLGAVAAQALVALGAVHANETIGPYTIVGTPVSATLVSGGGPAFNWLNVVNSPVSLDAAFSGFGVADDGYANAASGTTLRLGFAPGTLVNHPGPDLVLLDADGNLNVYLVSTNVDGFAHQVVASATTDTGVLHNYFLGGTGPTSLGVFGTTIDLSSLGIPNGQAVDQVQLFTEGPSNDLLGLGILPSPAQVPGVSSWGVVGASAMLLAAGVMALLRQRREAI